MTESYDLVGVGIGPFNLSLAALADGVPELRARFFDAKPAWSWHPGLLFDDARLQVPFLADLVTLVDPTSQWSFLSYLREHERLFPFYFSERFHVPRKEYDHYCRWVSERLPTCRFGNRVTEIAVEGDGFVVKADTETVYARNVVLGVGTEPVVPPRFADAVEHGGAFPAAEYLHRRDQLAGADDITVLGSGQTGAEVFLDLLRQQADRGWRLRWLTRSPAFAPMEYSKLGLEHFTPAYTSYFQGLPPAERDRLVPSQWQLYKAISADTIADIHDLLYERSVGGVWPDVTLSPNVDVTNARVLDSGRVELACRQTEQDREFTDVTDAVVLATGYAARRPDAIDPLVPVIDWDTAGRFQVDAAYRVALHRELPGALYAQNAEAHTHGVGAPDLGLGAYRAAVILAWIAHRPVYPLPRRTAFTTFGAPPVHQEESP